MELASKIREAINSNNEKEIRAVYFEVFGSSIKERCGNCYNKAIEQLIQFSKQNKNNMAVSCKYKFIKKFTGGRVILKIQGTRIEITEANMTNELAELMKAHGRGHLLEENKAYTEVPNVVAGVKKLTPETFAKPKDKPMPTLSTLKEAVSDGSELSENVSENKSNTSELTQLTASHSPKKRGRKPKVSA